MALKNLPHVDLLRQLLSYNPATGILRWRERMPDMFKAGNQGAQANCLRWNKLWASKVTGYPGNQGYLIVRLGDYVYQAHRLIWMMQHGTNPDEIDHINGDRADNRMANLRDVPRAENRLNQKRYTNNKSGVTGVFWASDRKKWRSLIRLDGKLIRLGQFNNIADAIKARKDAEVILGFHKNHGR